MATTTTAGVRLSSLPPAGGRAGFKGTLASEFTKLRSVRSTYWTIGSLLIVSIGLAAAIGAGFASQLNSHPGDKAGADATQISLFIFYLLGELVIAVLGAMTITAEYSTGMIRPSLTAMPRRGVLFGSKLAVFTVVTLIVNLVTAFLSFFVGQALLSGTGVSASLFHSVTVPLYSQTSPSGTVFSGSHVVTAGDALTAIIGTALYVTAAALIAFGFGAILRHTAGAISAAVGLLFVLTIVINFLPTSWHDDIIRFLPTSSGGLLTATLPQTGTHLWSTWPQFGVTLIWAAVLLAVGAYLFHRRDA